MLKKTAREAGQCGWSGRGRRRNKIRMKSRYFFLRFLPLHVFIKIEKRIGNIFPTELFGSLKRICDSALPQVVIENHLLNGLCERFRRWGDNPGIRGIGVSKHSATVWSDQWKA